MSERVCALVIIEGKLQVFYVLFAWWCANEFGSFPGIYCCRLIAYECVYLRVFLFAACEYVCLLVLCSSVCVHAPIYLCISVSS